ncbi:hypothetical protein HPB52_016372 [Rhipicephalus sanguineus]|uniref:Tick transposon n=1 Tax=Rhipicephalus sanguineus TaxID=34632 RepID=A0A9D4SNS7_RHISA|nr:hypothetical protein HPB52_016372 [Rhipicephalus sanguineus]
MIAVTTCRVRVLSFCIKKKVLPEEVRRLFGGFTPSQGHGSRICKILRAELQRQISSTPVNGAKTLRELRRHISMSTEFLWKTQLLQLRNLVPTRQQPPKWPIHNQEDLDLPQHDRSSRWSLSVPRTTFWLPYDKSLGVLQHKSKTAA